MGVEKRSNLRTQQRNGIQERKGMTCNIAVSTRDSAKKNNLNEQTYKKKKERTLLATLPKLKHQ